MIYISYYTKHTPYERVMATHLLPSLKEWELPYEIEALDDLGDWQRNTHYKAEFIYKMLQKHKQPVVFLDSDAIIQSEPLLFPILAHNKKIDMAAHYLDWYKFWRGEEKREYREVLSGTLYVAYNKQTLAFLEEWIKYNTKSKDWEQRNMQKILEQWKAKLLIYNLPIEYIVIEKPDGSYPDYIVEPVILHKQVSRQLKKRK